MLFVRSINRMGIDIIKKDLPHLKLEFIFKINEL